jgi:hypothetical protein
VGSNPTSPILFPTVSGEWSSEVHFRVNFTPTVF